MESGSDINNHTHTHTRTTHTHTHVSTIASFGALLTWQLCKTGRTLQIFDAGVTAAAMASVHQPVTVPLWLAELMSVC